MRGRDLDKEEGYRVKSSAIVIGRAVRISLRDRGSRTRSWCRLVSVSR